MEYLLSLCGSFERCYERVTPLFISQSAQLVTQFQKIQTKNVKEELGILLISFACLNNFKLYSKCA